MGLHSQRHLTCSARRKSRKRLLKSIRNGKKEKVEPVSSQQLTIDYPTNQDTEQLENEKLHIEYEKPLSRDYTQEISGRRIVDIQQLFTSLKSLKHDGFGCSFFDMDIISERRFGLKSVFSVKCNMCNFMSTFSTENDREVDINCAAVSGMISIGAGYSQFTELFSALNIPSMSAHTYAAKEAVVQEKIEECAWDEMKVAGKEEARSAKEAGSVDDDGIPIITVIVDGAWSKRSYKTNYNTLSGVACIIGARTKKIIYLGVKNKYCCVCEKYKTTSTSSPEHKCFKNWNGTSTSMEAAILVEGFKHSISLHGLKYGKIIGDGDSSVYKKICDNKPYGPHFYIEKIECRNHILRNYCNKIREIARTPKTDLTVRQFLKSSIMRFRTAVVSAVKFRKNENLPIEMKIIKLREDIRNGPKHIFGNHDQCKEDNHNYKYFCRGPKPMEQNLYEQFRSSSLFDEFQKCNNRVAQHASSLLHDVDSNHAENFNSIVNKLVGGKRINYSLKGSYEARCNAAAINFNKRGAFLDLALYKLGKGKGIGKYTSKYCNIMRSKRKIPQQKKKIVTCEADLDYGRPMELVHLDDTPLQELDFLKKQFIWNISNVDIHSIELSTRGQSNNPIWFKEKATRLTASNFGKICKMRKNTSTANTVKTILYASTFRCNATEYGILNESKAITKFEELYQLKVESCGLFIDTEKKYLAASPDGLIGNDGLIEIKCPYGARNMTVAEAVEKKTISYCTVHQKEGDISQILLKPSHDYMYQIQGQLHVTKRKFCYFVVYTQQDLVSQLILKDDAFWKTNMESQLQKFYLSAVLPELVDPRYSKNLPIRDIKCLDL